MAGSVAISQSKSISSTGPRIPLVHRRRQIPTALHRWSIACQKQKNPNAVVAAEDGDCASEAEDLSAVEAAEDAVPTEEWENTPLTNTTSWHDGWLHRCAVLADLALHTYVAHVVRIPRPSKARIADIQRVENVLPFDEHYDLATSHWQQLQILDFCVLLAIL